MEIQKHSDQTLHLVTEEINHMSVQRHKKLTFTAPTTS